MNAADLLTELNRLGIRLEARGDRLRYSPRSAMTDGLLEKLRVHKAGLLALLQPAPEVAHVDLNDAKQEVWQAALDRLEGDPLFCADLMGVLRSADVRWIDESPDCDLATEPIAESIGPDGWPTDCIDPDELPPCPKCGTLELWQSAAGDLFGLTPGRWRCMKCDPPTAAWRLAEAAERVRRRANRRTTTRQHGQYRR